MVLVVMGASSVILLALVVVYPIPVHNLMPPLGPPPDIEIKRVRP